MSINKVSKKIAQRMQAFRKHPLTRRRPYAALWRYLWFNTSQSLRPKKRIYRWIDGLKFYAEKGDAGIVANYYFKLFDYEESKFLIRKLTEESLFVDVGANLGHFTLLAAGVAKANVIAVEPIPSTYKKLVANVKLNELQDSVDCMNLGLGDTVGTLSFLQHRTVMNRVAIEGEENTIDVEVTTLDKLLLGKSPTFIKIDVEGYELPVLKGAHQTLSNPELKFLMLEFNDSGVTFGYSDEAVYELVRRFGFYPVSYDVKEDRVIRLESYNTHKFNTLFMRD